MLVRVKLYPNGRILAEYEMVLDLDGNEVRHGRYTSFWGNGQVFEQGQYDHGQPGGLWRCWFSSGRPMDRQGQAAANEE